MSKLTLGQKAVRVLKLLLGMRNARVVAALATWGFGTEDIEGGVAIAPQRSAGQV